MNSPLKTVSKKGSLISQSTFQTLISSNPEAVVLKNIFRDFGFIWSIFMLMCNFSIFVISFYFIGNTFYPEGLWLEILILLELLLITDIFLQFFLKGMKIQPNFFISLNFTTKMDKIYLFSNLITAFPQVIIFASLNNSNKIDMNDHFYGNFMSVRLIRIWNIRKFSSSLKEMLIFMNVQGMIILKFLENFIIIILSIHVFACGYLMIDKNSLEKGFFDNHQYESRTMAVKYLNSFIWSTYSLTGCSFNDVYPVSNDEFIFSLILLIIGSIIFGKIFGDFEKAMHIQKIEINLRKNNFSQCKAFSIDRDFPSHIKKRVKSFFNQDENYYQYIYKDIYTKLPTSLRTEISLNVNKDLIKKVPLFNLGSPFFVFSFFKELQIRIALKNDIILRKGEIFKEFYIIRKGKVEVISEDGKTLLAILEEGAFFGEISYFLTNKRTSTVRALTDCIFLVVGREKLDHLFASFPDERNYLMKVAGQRKKTCTKRDFPNDKRHLALTMNNIDMEIENFKRKSTMPLSLIRRNRSTNEIQFFLKGNFVFTELEGKTTDMINLEKNNVSLITNSSLDVSKVFEADISIDQMEKEFINYFIILPLSKFYYFFFYVLIIVFIYNLFYLPFALFFDFKLEGPYLIIDLISMTVYFLDLYVHCFTSFVEDNEYCNSLTILFKKYMSNGFGLDLLAFLPLDYGLIYIEAYNIAGVLRMLRLIKYFRILNMSNLVKKNSSKSFKYYKTIMLIFYLIISLHWSACIMFAISKYEYENGEQEHNLFTYVNHHHGHGYSLFTKSKFDIYIYFLYWSSECTGPPNEDVSAVSSNEKLFQIFMILFYKIYLSFLAAEFVQLLSIQKANYLNYINQLHMINEWSKHKQFPVKLKKRINNYYHCLWRVFKGTKDYEVLSILPETLRDEILLSMLIDFFSKIKFFPKDNPEILLSITKKLKIFAIPKGEFLCKHGEINTEIFFILEGYAALLSVPEFSLKQLLKPGDYHGEQEMIEGIYNTHHYSLKALTDLTIAQLSYKDLVTISNDYSILKKCFEINGNKTEKEESYCSIENFLNSSIFSNRSLKSLSKIEEEKDQDYSNLSFEKELPSFQNLLDLSMIENDKINDDIDYLEIIDVINEVFAENEMVNSIEFSLHDFSKGDSEKDYAVIEESSGGLDWSESSECENLIKEKISKKRKFSNLLNYICIGGSLWKSKGMKIFLAFIISLFNLIYIPLNMIFVDFDYSTEIIIIEGGSILYLGVKLFSKLKKYYRSWKNNNNLFLSEKNIMNQNLTKEIENVYLLQMKSKWKLCFSLIYDFLYLIPFPLIFTKSGWARRIYILNFIRLSNLKPLMNAILYIKVKNMNIGILTQILILSIVTIHVQACFFLYLAVSQNNINNSFLRRIDYLGYHTSEPDDTPKNNFTMYNAALYWVYGTLSKGGAPDLQIYTNYERIFAIFAINVGGLLYIYIFGNIVSLVENLRPKIKSLLEKNEKKVLKTLKNLKMDYLLVRFEKYFNFLWKSDKGMDENEILSNFPISIKVDIQKFQFLRIFRNSTHFSHGSLRPHINLSLIYSLIKFLKFEIYIPKDLIIIGGDFCNDIYFVMEGKVELISFDLKNKILLQPGDFFGGIINNERQPGYVKAVTFCKIGILECEHYEILKNRFPKWNSKLLNQYNSYKISLLLDLSFWENPMEEVEGFITYNNNEGEKVVNEKLIEHYYANYLKIEENNDDQDKEIVEKEKQEIKNLLKKNKLSKLDSSSMTLSKRQNIVNVIQKGKTNAELINRIKRISSKINPYVHSSTLTKILNVQRLYAIDSKLSFLPNSSTRVFFDAFHIIFMIYNTFALPFYVCFRVELNTIILILEIFYIFENFWHLIIEIKTSKYIDGLLTTNCISLFKNYGKTGLLFLDILCIVPLNLLLMGNVNVLLDIIRLTRLIQTFFLKYFIRELETKRRSLSKIFSVFKSFLLLACLLHWSSCLWMWCNFLESEKITWYLDLELDSESLVMKYIYCLYFIMNVVSTASYAGQHPRNNTERLLFIMNIYIGDAGFAIAFALIASNASVFPQKFNEIFKNIRRLKLALKNNKISIHLQKRIEEYFTHVVKMRSRDQNSLLAIKSFIPDHLYSELRYLHAKPFLLRFPIFSEAKSPLLLRELSERLQYAVYLPNDYIIIRNDIGEEMYFIIEGCVHVMNPREDDVMVTLSKGNYFGEIALFTANSKRICSVISGSFCELFILNKNFLNKTLDKFLSLKETFKKESERRFAEYRKQSLSKSAVINLKKNMSNNSIEKRGRSKTMKNLNIFKNSELTLTSQNSLHKINENDELVTTVNLPSESKFKKMSQYSPELKHTYDNNEEEDSPKSSSPMSKRGSINGRSNLLIHKLKLNDNDSDFEDTNKGELDGSICEYVEENELSEANLIKKRQSRRERRRSRERRYSRVTLRKEVNFSKNLGIELEWGININEDI